ncbi:MAG: response regulator [Cyanobacteria bacterium J06598_1]
MRILLVDDDEILMETLAEQLIAQRYAVDIAVDGISAGTYIELFDYDLVVLDLMLPDGDGIEFAKAFRQGGYANPVMILTAKESTAEKVRALDAGADDYVVKPFDFAELCARIRALLRREHQGLPTVLAWGPLRLDPSACETTYKNQPIRLTPKEFSLMELFLRHPHRVYSLGAIIEDLWSFEDPPGEDAVRTHIKGLRRKLEAADAPKDLIKTVYGLGYRLNENTSWPTDERPRTILPAAVPPAIPTEGTQSYQAILQQKLADACRRYLCSASVKVRTLEQVVSGLAKEDLKAVLFHNGLVCAHQLAGSLGSFGFAEGSKIAGNIEQTLRSTPAASAVETAQRATETPVGDPAVGEPAVEEPAPMLSAAAVTQLQGWVQALRQQIDQASVPDSANVLVDSVRNGLPVLLIVSEDTALVQQLVAIAANAQLQTKVVANSQQAEHCLQSMICDLVLIDAATAFSSKSAGSDMSSDLSAVVTRIKSDYALPLGVLSSRLDLHTRLGLIRSGVDMVSDRTSPPLQIMLAAAGLIKAEVSQVHVAIADDDPELRALLQTSLAPWGFQIIPFSSASELWTWLSAAEPPSVDLLVLDIDMPHLSGLELCRVIRADARFQAMPILFLTHHQEASLRAEAYQSGGDDFIHKAVAPTELAIRLRNQLTRACSLLNQSAQSIGVGELGVKPS